MKGFKALLVIISILISIFLQVGDCFAYIPEPNNIFYGIVIANGELLTAESQATISLKLEPASDPISTYTLGSNLAVGDYYVLRVPIYAHASEDSNVPQPGDEANIYVNDELAGIINIGERGNIQVIHLDTNLTADDNDGDGLSNSLEIALGTDPNTSDTDEDGLSDGDEVNTFMTDPLLNDTDGDGLSDGWEVDNNTDPLVINDGTSVEMNLPAGWSMISIPVIADNSSVSSLFPDAVVVYGYDRGAGYVRIKVDENMEAGKGYWILFNDSQNYTLNGQAIQYYTITEYEDGWHMIGGCSSAAKALTDNCTISVIYSYVQGSGYQLVLGSQNLGPGKGYWILCKDIVDSCKLTVEITGQN